MINSPTVFPDWLAQRAASSPAQLALAAGGREWTFAQLDEEATRIARILAASGVGPGELVATCLHNGALAAVLPHAVLRLGATLVPLNVRLSEAELAWQLQDARPGLLLVDQRTKELFDSSSGAARKLTIIETNSADAVRNPGASLLPGQEADIEPILVHDASFVLATIYTSGTTGKPRGAMLTAGNFWWSATGSALRLGTRDDDRWLAVLPLFHVGGLSIVIRGVIQGTTVVVHDSFDASAVNRALDDDRISIVSVVPVMLQRMLDARNDRPYPQSLRCVLTGGGPVPRSLLERCERVSVPVVQTYGLTETTSQVATLAPDEALRKPGAAGLPLHPNEISISVGGRTAEPDEPGEILVRGPIVMAGYHGKPDATGQAIVDHWLHTGDAGYLDRDGYLYVLDRRDDLIVSGGENVYPAEVESALLAHRLVVEAGVVGVRDDVWGHRVIAFVHLAGQPAMSLESAAEELQAHCRALIAGYKVPREIRFTSEPLPRTASGKLRRVELRQWAEKS